MIATVQEAADTLGISARTMRQHCAHGNVIGARYAGSPPRGVWLIPVDNETGRPKMRRNKKGPRPRWAEGK